MYTHFQTNKPYFLSTKFNQNTFLYTQLVSYKVGAELMQEMDIDKDGQVLIFLIFLCQDNVTFLLHIVIMKIHSKTGLPPILFRFSAKFLAEDAKSVKFALQSPQCHFPQNFPFDTKL